MSDFVKTILGVIVGGLITLGANVFLSNLTTQKEARAELRGKLETLNQNHLADFGCYSRFIRDGKETDRCEEGQFGLKALGLANIYFPLELAEALNRFGSVRDAGMAARLECNLKYSSQSQYVEQLKCATSLISKFRVANEAGNIAAAINKQAKSLRSE